MEEETKNASEFSFITEGEFEVFKQGEIVFYASESKISRYYWRTKYGRNIYLCFRLMENRLLF